MAMVVGTLAIGAGALFTELDSVSNNTFSTATVIIDAAPVSSGFAVPAMKPGEASVVSFTVANAGSTELRYAMTSETTEDVLAAELVLTVRQDVATCDLADWDTTGSQIYQGKLGDTTTVGGWPIFGDATAGVDPGDRVLASSSAEALCFHVELPASSTVQNSSTTATFNFLAEQTTNN